MKSLRLESCQPNSALSRVSTDGAEISEATRSLSRRPLGVFDYFVDSRSELIYARARDDDGIAAAVCFLGDAKKFAAVVLTKFHVKMLTLDLQFPRLDEIIHVCKKPRSLGRSASKREAVFLAKKRAGNGSIENRFGNGLTPSCALFRVLISDGEVDLTFKGVDSRNENANLIPD